jgi:serine/threonine protein kinase
MGMDRKVEVDYQAIPLEEGELLVLATDGVYEFTDAAYVAAAIKSCAGNLDQAAQAIVEEALKRGSGDNLTVQIVRVDELPSPESNEMYRQISELPFPPLLDARMDFDGYRIVREIKGSARSHIYLAVDSESGENVVIKTPSVDLQANPAYLERFLMEEWIARRINSPHVLKPCSQTRKRHYIYVVTEYIEGQTLAQWMIDNPKPDLPTVRGLIEQIAKGLQAFHRLEMVYQDLKPDNIMIDSTGTVKIIDFGATRVAGVMEIATPIEQINLLGSPPTPHRNTSSAKTARRAPTSSRSASSPTRCSPASCPTASKSPNRGPRQHNASSPIKPSLTKSAKSPPGSTMPSVKPSNPTPSSATRNSPSSSTTCITRTTSS